MGEVEIDSIHNTIIIRSHIITYGDATTDDLTEQIRAEIEQMWNEPEGQINLKGTFYRVSFSITAECKPNLDVIEIYSNIDPRNNYFRIEDFAHGNISFVDAIGCNSGYFKLENLYAGSTTAAHEYGHTIGLDHPEDLDYRSKGIPRIMYPRGTLVDPEFQYDPKIPAGVTGGTMHPMYRKVFTEDILLLKLEKLRFKNQRAIVGDFTNVFHPNHRDIRPGDQFTAAILS